MPSMRHHNALLKRIRGAERANGALAIVNHHTHRLGTHLSANSEVLIGTIAVQYFFPVIYRNPLQGRPGPESRPRTGSYAVHSIVVFECHDRAFIDIVAFHLKPETKTNTMAHELRRQSTDLGTSDGGARFNH